MNLGHMEYDLLQEKSLTDSKSPVKIEPNPVASEPPHASGIRDAHLPAHVDERAQNEKEFEKMLREMGLEPNQVNDEIR